MKRISHYISKVTTPYKKKGDRIPDWEISPKENPADYPDVFEPVYEEIDEQTGLWEEILKPVNTSDPSSHTPMEIRIADLKKKFTIVKNEQ